LTKIFYFSGTGNSLWSAKKIAELTEDKCELINIGAVGLRLNKKNEGAEKPDHGRAEEQDEKFHVEAERVVLIFPAYAYGPPIIVSKFVRNTEFKTPYIAVLVTYGTSPGGALASIRRKLKKKNIKASYFSRIPAVENYISIFGVQKTKTINKRLEMQKKATMEAAMNIRNKQTNRINSFRPVSAFVSLLFSLGIKIFHKWYKVGQDCDGCGLCAKFCPVSGIVMQNQKPMFTKNCEHCQACLNWCPQHAIFFARIRSGTQRYHHPEINISDMIH